MPARCCSGRRPATEAELEVLAIDKGPGIGDLQAALEDGRSTAGTTGIGLGAARRMSDEFDIYSGVPHGTVVLARIRPNAARRRSVMFDVSGVSVAKAGETECGDAWTLDICRDSVSAFVADGLGHGHFAAQAANAAIAAAALGGRRGGCAQTLAVRPRRHSSHARRRGAIAEVTLPRARRDVCRRRQHRRLNRQQRLGPPRGFAQRHLGHQARIFREYSYPWQKDSLLVMHSDGLGTHWSLAGYPGLRQRHPAVIAGVLYRDFNRGRDDVTVVVAREAA